MRKNRHKRQILLFLAAVLMPAGVLIGLAGRIVYQDRELAAKRAVDQRHAAVEQVRRELSSRLETIKLQEINRLMRPPDSRGTRGSANPAVIFTATLENDRLVLPWEPGNTPDEPTPDFLRYRQAGEAQEFIQKNYSATSAAYRLALASARRLQGSAEAQLALARTLFKAGQTEEAMRQFHALMNSPAEARDEQGVSFRFYAAERLMAAPPGRGAEARIAHDLSPALRGIRPRSLRTRAMGRPSEQQKAAGSKARRLLHLAALAQDILPGVADLRCQGR